MNEAYDIEIPFERVESLNDIRVHPYVRKATATVALGQQCSDAMAAEPMRRGPLSQYGVLPRVLH